MKMWILEQRVATAPAEEAGCGALAGRMLLRQRMSLVWQKSCRLRRASAKVTAVSYQQFRGFDGEQL
jgi:hypothetical protein